MKFTSVDSVSAPIIDILWCACNLALPISLYPLFTLQALNLLTDPAGALSAIHGREVPWQTILWTGLASTDLALLIEVRPQMCRITNSGLAVMIQCC